MYSIQILLISLQFIISKKMCSFKRFNTESIKGKTKLDVDLSWSFVVGQFQLNTPFWLFTNTPEALGNSSSWLFWLWVYTHIAIELGQRLDWVAAASAAE